MNAAAVPPIRCRASPSEVTADRYGESFVTVVFYVKLFIHNNIIISGNPPARATATLPKTKAKVNSMLTISDGRDTPSKLSPSKSPDLAGWWFSG